jgi:hypothetical protein
MIPEGKFPVLIEKRTGSCTVYVPLPEYHVSPVWLSSDTSANGMTTGVEPERGIPPDAAPGITLPLAIQRLMRIDPIIILTSRFGFISDLPEQTNNIRKVNPAVPVEIECTYRNDYEK